jgi:hypothetical protein
MKTNKSLTIMFAIALWVTSPLANAIYMDSFQGLTFTFDQTTTTQLSFNIAGTPSGDWSTAQYLGSFDLKDLGLDFSTVTATLNGPGAINLLGSNSQLSASNLDCSKSTGEKGTICFEINTSLGAAPIDLKYTIDFSSDLNISSLGPHLQIAFLENLELNKKGEYDKVGSLYSQNVGGGEDVPEPGPLALVSIGLLGLAFSQRKRISNR